MGKASVMRTQQKRKREGDDAIKECNEVKHRRQELKKEAKMVMLPFQFDGKQEEGVLTGQTKFSDIVSLLRDYIMTEVEDAKKKEGDLMTDDDDDEGDGEAKTCELGRGRRGE